MARIFNGTTDRIDFANVFNSTGAPLTVSLWVNLDVLAGPNNQYFWNNSPAGGGGGTIFYNLISAPTGSLAFFRSYSTTNKSKNSVGGVLTAGAWQHVLVTDDGGTAHANTHIYRNGSEVSYDASSNDGVGTEVSESGVWSLGGRLSDDLRNFDGRIAEAGVWRRILSLSDIVELARGYSPLFYPGLLFYTPLEGGTPERNLVGATATSMDGTSVQSFPVPIRYPRGRPRHLLFAPAAAAGADQPTMRRWGGVPGMTPGGVTIGRSW